MDLFQADSEALQEVVQIFQAEMEYLEQSLQSFQGVAENIRGYGWIGLGAEKFFDEYNSELVPQANKIIQKLEGITNQVAKVARLIETVTDRILSVAKSPI